jgi:soluble lytic murein transglycosylase
MGALDRVRSKLSPEEWRYVGAGALGFFGLVTWALGVRTMRARPRLGDQACPVEVYIDVLVNKHGGKERDARGAWTYEPLIVDAAIHFGFPPDVLMAMAHTESRFQPTAESSAGALGLIQILPSTGKWLHERLLGAGNWPFLGLDLRDPEQSAWMAAFWMSDMLKKRTLENAIATYNAGGKRVRPGTPEEEWPAETRRYVPAVLRRARYYREIWNLCGTVMP